MLGYGGTAQPLEADAYRHKCVCISLLSNACTQSDAVIAEDLRDILDSLSIDQVVAIGHDW